MFGRVVNTSFDSPLVVLFIYNGCAYWTNIRYDNLKLQYEIDWVKNIFSMKLGQIVEKTIY